MSKQELWMDQCGINPNRDIQNGTYNGDTTYCPVNAYGDCPYCDQCNVCHIADPMEECDDWGIFWSDWDEWVRADDTNPDAPDDFAEDEIKWAGDVYGYEDTWEDNENEESF